MRKSHRWLAALGVMPLALVAVTAGTANAGIGAGWNQISNIGSGKCLDVRTEDNYIVQQWSCHNVTEQGWAVFDNHVIDGVPYILIENERNGTCLGIDGGSANINAEAVVNPCGGDDTYWQEVDSRPKDNVIYVSLRNKHSGLCLDLNNASRSDGALIHQYICNGNNAQYWRL